MTPSDQLYKTLKEAGLNFFVSVPCKLAQDLITRLEKDAAIIYTPVAREEEGIGITAGAYLAGRRPAIVMQNSGFGNSINAILSLLNYYQIPEIFVMTHRGSPGEPIRAQDGMGSAIKDLMRASNVDCYEIPSTGQLDIVRTGIEQAYKKQRSAGFLFPFSFWAIP